MGKSLQRRETIRAGCYQILKNCFKFSKPAEVMYKSGKELDNTFNGVWYASTEVSFKPAKVEKQSKEAGSLTWRPFPVEYSLKKGNKLTRLIT